MKRWVLACSALLVPSAAGQTVDEIVARHIAARGGAARLAAVQSVRMTAKARAQGGRQALVVREVKRPGKIRLEFTTQGVTGVYAIDGERGWQVSPLEGELEPRAMAPEGVRQALEQADIGGPLLDWKAKGHRLSLAGQEALDGRPAFKLSLNLKSGETREIFIDAASFHHVRTEATRTLRGQKLHMQTTFADYREAGGVLFPHAIEIGAKDRPTRLRIAVSKVEVDPPLPDARFRMPEGTR
jgi:outer membrane lipoprotein-sorting protein